MAREARPAGHGEALLRGAVCEQRRPVTLDVIHVLPAAHDDGDGERHRGKARHRQPAGSGQQTDPREHADDRRREQPVILGRARESGEDAETDCRPPSGRSKKRTQ